MTSNQHSLSERITQHYERLTQSSRRVADYLQGNPEKILMLSTAEIADACEVSKTSVSRFIRQLGYDDHMALRRELIDEREKGVPVITSSTVEDAAIRQEMAALENLWSQLSTMDVSAVVEQLIQAKRVVVIGYRNSYPLAMHFRQQLMQCRANVSLLPLPGQTLGEDISTIGCDDFVVLFGIRRRVEHFSRLVEFLADKPGLLITDQSGQQYANKCQHFLMCQMNNQAPLDSYAVPMSLISYLVNKVYRQLGSEAVKQSRNISHNYAALNEVE
ncbi:SIS domain-containing protein [Vibrio sp. CAIM 722]|uniref:SIS domain-containing protein n=1 Tax=Vibrio eleionomae TaxID=2653505 RepID=A0A7X4LJZ9_9VIBR|nr:MurR/RpiR family transcriptional regulator [Vibrio eleionomae]MZI93375.1 SIS domain-containing protein [Vibrio eleionomae]